MMKYGATFRVYYTLNSATTATTRSHTIEYGNCDPFEPPPSGAIVWNVTPNPDDSIGFQGNYEFVLSTATSSYTFSVTYVCNNMFNNSVVVARPDNFDVTIVPSAEIIKTQAPMDVTIIIVQK